MPNRLEQTLLGDIGATNARFSLLANGALGPVSSFEVARYARFPDVVTAFLKMHGDRVPVTHAVLAVAGPVEGERCKLTNWSWTVDGDELRTAFSLAKVRVVNDFAATAYSLPSLNSADLHAIGGGPAFPPPPMPVARPRSVTGPPCPVPA